MWVMCRMERDWKKLEQHVKEQEVVSELDLMAYETVSCVFGSHRLRRGPSPLEHRVIFPGA